MGRILKAEGRRRDVNQTKFSRWPFPTMDIDLCSERDPREIEFQDWLGWISMEFDKLVSRTVPEIYFG